jgi:hypothetical protein
MLMEMRQDVVKEQYKITQTKIGLLFKHSLNNAKYVGYLNAFKTGFRLLLDFYIL